MRGYKPLLHSERAAIQSVRYYVLQVHTVSSLQLRPWPHHAYSVTGQQLKPQT